MRTLRFRRGLKYLWRIRLPRRARFVLRDFGAKVCRSAEAALNRSRPTNPASIVWRERLNPAIRGMKPSRRLDYSEQRESCCQCAVAGA
jgi:hypothetical protein